MPTPASGYYRLVNAFRVVALGYALSALLIAPAWLSADELTAEPAPDQAPAAEPAPGTEAETVAEPAPADEPAVEEAPVEAAQQEEEPPAQAEFGAAEAEGPEPDAAPVATVAASASVTITDFEFAPKSVTVNVGETVTWTNDGPTQHSATADDGSFDTDIMAAGKSGSATFNEAGTISYICTPHPFMKGTVVVQGDSAGSDDSGPDDTIADDDSSDSAGATDTTDDGSGLPATGGETLLIALLGLATLASGVLIRRRAEG